MTEQFCDVGRGVTLCYETFGDPSDPPLLLIMGLGMQMIRWNDEFCGELVSRGFFVVRFDNRDSGRSTHVDCPPPTLRQLLTRRFDERQYALTDMARDAAELLRRLELAPAHVMGASLGGMIAQTVAAEHPSVVRSLVSVMSSPGGRFSGQPALRTYPLLLARPVRDRSDRVAAMERMQAWIGSPVGDEEDRRMFLEMMERGFERDDDRLATGRQLAAILRSGDRTKQLRRVVAPTLVIHGTVDRMIHVSGGRATAKAIPGAWLLEVPDMGHDLPHVLWPRILDAVADHAHRADEGVADVGVGIGSG